MGKKPKQQIRCYDCEYCDLKNGRCEEGIIIPDHDLTHQEVYDYRRKDCDGYIKRKRLPK